MVIERKPLASQHTIGVEQLTILTLFYSCGCVNSGLGDGSILIWCLTSGRVYHLDGHADAVVRVGFSHDGRFLASMDPEEKVAIWSTSVHLVLKYFIFTLA